MQNLDYKMIESDLKEIIETNSVEDYHFYLSTYKEEIDVIEKDDHKLYDKFFDSLLKYLIENKSFDILMELVDKTKEMMNIDIYNDTNLLTLCVKNDLPFELRNKIVEHKFFYYENNDYDDDDDDDDKINPDNSGKNRLLCLKFYELMHQMDEKLKFSDKSLTIFTLGTPENKRLIELLDNEYFDISEIKANKYSSNQFESSPMFLSFSNLYIKNMYENVIIPIIKRQDKDKRIKMILDLNNDIKIVSSKININLDFTLKESDIVLLDGFCDDFMVHLFNEFKEEFIYDIMPNNDIIMNDKGINVGFNKYLNILLDLEDDEIFNSITKDKWNNSSFIHSIIHNKVKMSEKNFVRINKYLNKINYLLSSYMPSVNINDKSLNNFLIHFGLYLKKEDLSDSKLKLIKKRYGVEFIDKINSYIKRNENKKSINSLSLKRKM